MKKNPGVTIQVTGSGSGVGLAALINGTTDIAQASRPMKDSEKEQLMKNRSLPLLNSRRAQWLRSREKSTDRAEPGAVEEIYTGAVKN